MRTATRLSGISIVFLVLVALSGCSNGSDGGDHAPSSTTSDSGTPPTLTTATPTPSSTEAAAHRATALVKRYYDIRNLLRQDPKRPLAMLKTVTVSNELSAQEKLFASDRARGIRQIGDTKVAELQVQGVNLDNSDPTAGKVPTVQIDVCFDVSDVDLVNAQGKSVVNPNRPDTGWIRFSVANYNWTLDPDGSWRVASSQDLERAPCAAS